MRDVDEALTWAYARHKVTEPASVPPPPHFPRRMASPPRAETPPTFWPPEVSTLERQASAQLARLANVVGGSRQGHGARTILIASAHRAEGRTTLVLALARALARLPLRVLIVDADAAAPALSRRLGPSRGPRIHDTPREIEKDRIYLLPMDPNTGGATHARRGPAWNATLARLRRAFDVILVDGGPLLTGGGARGIPEGMDAALLLRGRLADAAQTESTRKTLVHRGIPILGVVQMSN